MRSALVLLAELHLQRGQPAAAEPLVLKLLDASPLDATAWYTLGLVRLAQGDVAAYQRGCHELITRYVQSDEPPFPGWELAWCCKLGPLAEDDLPEVERVAREALAAAPASNRAQHELSCILYRAGKFAESLEHQRAALAANPRMSAWMRIWISMAQSRLGNCDEAKQQLSEAVEQSQEQSATWGAFSVTEYELLRAKRNRSCSLRRRNHTHHPPLTETNRFAGDDSASPNTKNVLSHSPGQRGEPAPPWMSDGK